jgi:hypothetical protein
MSARLYSGISSRLFGCVTTMLLGLIAGPALAGSLDVLTQKYNNQHTGANLAETQLNTSNVNQTSFGKVWTWNVDDHVYAQPLYVESAFVNGATHNVVYVCTMNNSVYCFDADSSSSTPLWSRLALNVPVPRTDLQCCCNDVQTNFGIEGTPVIDQATRTMYFVSRFKDASSVYHQRLYAVNALTGADKLGGPVEISGSYTASGNTVTFDPKKNNQRPALILNNGQLLIAWSSHNDCTPYSGWVIAFNPTTLARNWAWADTVSGARQGGIWMSGQGVSIDPAGNILVTTGNGAIDQVNNNFAMSLVKLNPATGAVLDYFCDPVAISTYNGQDNDLGSGGVMVMPANNNVVFGGKEGHLYQANDTNLGHVTSSNTQNFPHPGTHIHSAPVYATLPLTGTNPLSGPTIYFWPQEDHLQAYLLNTTTGLFPTAPSQSGTAVVPSGHPGGMNDISANGTAPGTAIVWTVHATDGDANQTMRHGILRAYDATNLGSEIYNSLQNAARDDYIYFPKYNHVTVARGRVYTPTFGTTNVAPLNGTVCVYGLLNTSAPTPPSGLVAFGYTTTTVSLRWLDNASTETGYIVENSTDGQNYAQIGSTLAANTTSTTITGLNQGTGYYFRVRAAGSTNSVPSNIMLVSTDGTPAGLIAWWKMDDAAGSTTFADTSGAGAGTGSFANAATISANSGRLGNAVTLNGNNQYGTVVNTAILNPTAAISVAAWVKASTWGTGNPRLVEKGLTDNQYRLTVEFGLIKFNVFNVGTVSANVPTAGFWHHVVGSYNGAKLQLWIDGALAGSVAATGAIPTTADNLFIGTKSNASPAGNGALTNADVAFLVGTSPVAFFDNFESGTTNWTVVQGTFTTVSDTSTRYKTSSPASVTASTAGSSSWTNYSITAYAKTTAVVAAQTNTGPRMFARFTDLNNRYWLEYNHDSGKFVLQKRLAGALTTLATSTGTFTIAVNTEFQMKLKVNGPTLEGWYNGVKVVSASDSGIISGKPGVGANLSDVEWDDVVINNLSAN